MALENYKLHILDLAQRWRLDMLNDAERSELETWFWSLEEKGLGVATEITVDKLEKRLHQLLGKISPRSDQEDEPPYPFK